MDRREFLTGAAALAASAALPMQGNAGAVVEAIVTSAVTFNGICYVVFDVTPRTIYVFDDASFEVGERGLLTS